MKRVAALCAIGIAAVAVAGLSLAGTTPQRPSQPALAPAPTLKQLPAAKQAARGTTPATKQRAAAKKTRASADTDAVRGQSQPASANPASYWTPERQDAAQPTEKTLPGGNGTGSDSAGAGTTSAGTKGTAGKQSSADGDVRSSGTGKSADDPAWTPEAMEDAAPMEKTAPGGDGSGGQASPPGGGTAPAAP